VVRLGADAEIGDSEVQERLDIAEELRPATGPLVAGVAEARTTSFMARTATGEWFDCSSVYRIVPFPAESHC
jgi:hypothetical protein